MQIALSNKNFENEKNSEGKFLGFCNPQFSTQKMQALLENAKITEKKMRAQEEEMRQNMEEPQTTQDELVRRRVGKKRT
jgi:hypothetical protein